MRAMKTAAASDTMLSSGANHIIALDQTPETKHLIAAIQPTHEKLKTATEIRLQAENAIGAPRVVIRFTEKRLEKVIREIALLAHAEDDNAITGPAFKALFPNGLEPELTPQGASQIAATASLRERLDSQPAAAKIKAQVMDKLDQALATFKASFEARQAAEAKLSQARAAEMGARESFVKAYDSNIGAIRQIFPRDRAQQDLYFDEAPGRATPAEPPPAPDSK
jgi:hypothetical protein